MNSGDRQGIFRHRSANRSHIGQRLDPADGWEQNWYDLRAERSLSEFDVLLLETLQPARPAGTTLFRTCFA
jgi:hypothetical protein